MAVRGMMRLGWCGLSMCAATFGTVRAAVNPANGHDYFLTPASMTFQEARTYAASVGGALASITRQSEQDWINEAFLDISPTASIWIGFTDEVEEAQWVWDTGEPVDYLNWGGLAPNDYPSSPTGEDYAALALGSGAWEDWSSPIYFETVVRFYGVIEVDPGPCLGDANYDRVVDFIDIMAVLAKWGENYQPEIGTGDCNRDGIVDFGDVLATLANWGATCP